MAAVQAPQCRPGQAEGPAVRGPAGEEAEGRAGGTRRRREAARRRQEAQEAGGGHGSPGGGIQVRTHTHAQAGADMFLHAEAPLLRRVQSQQRLLEKNCLSGQPVDSCPALMNMCFC